MDLSLRIRLELDSIKTEHLKRPDVADRRDLLSRLRAVCSEAKTASIPEAIFVALLRSADILLDQNRPLEAMPLLLEASDQTVASYSHERKIDLLVHQARAYAQLHNWREASVVSGEGIDLVEAARSKVSPQGLHSAYMRFKIQLYEIGARAAFELRDFEVAFQRAELAKCASARRMANGLQRDRRSDKELRDRYREVCAAIDQPDLTEAALAQLKAKRRATWDLLSIHQSRLASTGGIDSSALGAYKHLGADEVLIFYFWTDPRTLLVFAARPDELVATRVDLLEDDRELLDLIPVAALNFKRAEGLLRQPITRHTELLLPSEILAAAEAATCWLVSPHRMLHLIPFHALPLNSGYVIDQFPVTYVPNLHAALMRHEPIEHQSMCGIGVRYTSVLGPNGKPLAELANAEEEVEEIAEAFRCCGMEAKSIVGPAAGEGDIRALDEAGELATFTHVHVACHGSAIDSDSPLEAWLALSDTPFDGLDIAGLHIDAEIIYLSGCSSGQRPLHMPVVGETGELEELPGDEIFGLPAAFFAAGARQVISTLWVIDSDPARKISNAFYKAYLKGASADIALQQAILEYRKTAGPFSRGPDKWAPFFVTVLSRPSFDHSKRI